MAKLIAKCKGDNNNETHRLGHTSARCSVESYNSGVYVSAVITEDKKVLYRIYKTKGSNDIDREQLTSFTGEL